MRVLYGRRISLSTRSLPLWSGRCRWGTTTGEPLTTSLSSRVKYAGSTEESLSHRRPGVSAMREISAARVVRGTRSQP